MQPNSWMIVQLVIVVANLAAAYLLSSQTSSPEEFQSTGRFTTALFSGGVMAVNLLIAGAKPASLTFWHHVATQVQRALSLLLVVALSYAMARQLMVHQ